MTDPESPPDDRPHVARRHPPYRRSVALAGLAWAAAAGCVLIVAFLGLDRLVGWVGLVGFVIGGWFGGSRGGIKGVREWLPFGALLVLVVSLLLGLGSCVYAMALYG